MLSLGQTGALIHLFGADRTGVRKYALVATSPGEH